MRRIVLLVLVAVAAGCSTTGGGGARPTDAFARGDALFSAGDYDAAAEAYEAGLARRGGRVERGDAILLRLAILYLVMGTPERDPERGEATLRKLVDLYPKSRLREPAEYILSLRRGIEALEAEASRARRRSLELERQLEELKRIDLERRD